MLVQDIMAHEVINCAPGDSILSAAQLMRDRNVGCVVVTDGGPSVGILSDRDVTVRAAAEGRDLRSPVSECMTTPVTTVGPEADIMEVAHLMVEKRVRRMPVERDGRILGLVSFTDISWALERPVHDILYGGAAAVRRPAA
jgi:signal-transduction protein with cAMP-binding, CBS, and nucleotidyltransferase domain